VRLRSGFASNVGLVRQTNEDSYLVRNGLYVVCDGMGGARAGEVASEMACRALLDVDPKLSDATGLLRAVRDANRAIADRSFEHERLTGMGTTLTAALVGGDALTLIHVGDSRAYLFHEGHLAQLTNDHSWVGEMMRRGELTPNEAAVHPHRSVITKALGTDLHVDPDVMEFPFAIGDRLLLCSDGLTGMVPDPDIADILGRDEEPKVIAALLVQAALMGGGEDNVTVVVAQAVADADEEVADGDVASSEDEPVFGPEDRGLQSAHRGRMMPLKGRRPSATVRERLGKKVGPFLRPVAEPGAKAAPPPAEVWRRGWTRRKWIILAVVVALVIVVAIAGFAVVNTTIYYVGASDGVVALYRGLPGTVLGISLSSVIEEGTVAYASLAPYVQSRVDAHDLVTKEEGQLFLRTLSAAP
jgi:serine/threonine protein phosphatase PrpC